MKFNFFSIVNVVAHALLYATTALLVITAILVSIIRWHPDLSDIVEQKIETRLAEILNADITIESLDISRNKLFSEIVAQNVKVIDRQDSENFWQLRKARLEIDLTKTIFTQSLRIKEVALEGFDLSLLRDESGDLHVNQIFLLSSGDISQSDNKAGSKYADVRLSLLDSSIHWLDELTQTDYLFKDIDILIDPTSRGYDASLSGDLPENLGKSLQAYLRFEGNVNQLADATINFYVKTKQFRLSEVAKRFVGDSANKVPAVLDSEVWGEYSDKTLSALKGSIAVERIVEQPKRINSELCLSDEYIQQLSMQFDWNNTDRDWQFLANNLEVVTSKRDWPESYLRFELQRHSLNAKTILAHLHSIDLGAVCNTLHAYSPHIVRFEDQLKYYRVNANIEDLFIRFALSENYQSSYQYSAQFSDTSIWTRQGNRLVTGVSGFVEGGDAGGEVLLDSDEIGVRVPEQFPGFDIKLASKGKVKWSHNEGQYSFDSQSLRLFNEDFDIDARLNVMLSGDDIYTDSQFYINYFDARALGNYFPLFKKTRRTKKWLADALHKGEASDATVLIRGNMRQFPFHKSSGVFQTLVDVDNGVLEYKKGWPVLDNVQATVAIDKDNIKVSSRQADTINSEVKKVDINIDSFLLAVLELKGTVDGPAQDLLYYLGETGLVRKTNSVVDQITFRGDSRLEVDFSRSLSLKVDQPAQVSGNIRFLGNALNIKKVGIELKDLAGEVGFDAQGASADSINASLYGHPVNLSLAPAGNGASDLRFNGEFNLSEYLAQRYPRFKPFFSGTSQVQGELYIPSFFKKNNPEKLKLSINSNLIGIDSKLPEPLNKDKSTNMQATIEYDQKLNAMSWRVADRIGLHFSLKPQQPFALRMIDLNANQNLVVADQGMTIKGTWNELDPKLWLAAYKRFVDSDTSQSGNTAKPDIDVKIDSLLLPSWPAKNLQVKATQKDSQYVIDINSSLGKGIIQIPEDKQQAMSVNMNTLTINKQNNSAEKSAAVSNKPQVNIIDPRKLRPFKFSSDRLIINDIKLSDVSVNADINDQGMAFNNIKIAAQDLTGDASGAWKVKNNQHKTSFKYQVESIDVEDSLKDLGFNSSLKKGEASFSGNARWDFAPHQFELSKLSGDVTFNISDGSVSEIDPGNAGRLLALLNLGAISRRLSLDFKDVTNKGFSFDEIKGDLVLSEGGELETKNVSINASAADITINGKTNLIEQTYNQSVVVIPELSGTYMAAGGLIGGPVGIGVGAVVDQVSKAVGLNKISEIEYKMTGTWEEPIIKTVSSKQTKEAVINKGQPSVH